MRGWPDHTVHPPNTVLRGTPHQYRNATQREMGGRAAALKEKPTVPSCGVDVRELPREQPSDNWPELSYSIGLELV